jgi:hypothetical protein
MKQELSLWSLIENNEFDKACEKADKEFISSGSLLVLRNKVYALFHLKEYFAAISVGEQLIKITKGDTESDFKFLGIANWIVANTTKAVEVWQESKNCIYKDASGGIETQLLLYFAGIKIGHESLKAASVKTIKKLLKSKRAINWPGPLAHYLINDITEIELFAYVSTTPILKERQLCQAHFVTAIKKLEAGDNDGYYKKLKDCISYGPQSYLEQMYYLAKGELETV